MRVSRHILVLLVCLLSFSTSMAIQRRRDPANPTPAYILPYDSYASGPEASVSRRIMTRAAMASGSYSTGRVPTTGDVEIPVILVDFPDVKFSISDTLKLIETFDKILNGPVDKDREPFTYKDCVIYPPTGSVAEYFRDQSYGRYRPSFKITGPVHSSRNMENYGRGSENNVLNLVREACDSVMSRGLADLTRYVENDSLKQLLIIYAGQGENYPGSDPRLIWPHYNTLTLSYISSSLFSHGIKSITYACSNELFWDSDTIIDGIGVICHEFSHILGLQDYYDTYNYSGAEINSAMGYWSLMDYGSYENEGFSPVGYSAFDKFSLGWLDLEEVGTPADYTLHEIGTEPDPANGVHTAYRLSTPYDNIYFIMENRQKTGWYRYSATEGMLVTAVNYNASNWNNNTINVSTKRLYSVNADNDNNRKTNAGDLFPYGDEDSLTTAGSPSLSIDGTAPYYSLYGIRNQNGLVTFTVSSKMPARVQEHADSDVDINFNDGVLTVSAPCGSRLSVHDLSGHAILETVMTEPTFQTVLPEHGVWLIRCGNKTRKVRN